MGVGEVTPGGARAATIVRTRSARDTVPFVVLVVMTVAAGIAAVGSSGGSHSTVTPLVDTSAASFDGPMAYVSSPIGHAVCSQYDGGHLCVTPTALVDGPVRITGFPPTSFSSGSETVFEPTFITVSVDNSGSRTFVLPLTSRSTTISVAYSSPTGARYAPLRLVSSGDGASCATPTGELLAIPPHRAVALCLRFALEGAWVRRAPPRWSTITVGGVAAWQSILGWATPSGSEFTNIAPELPSAATTIGPIFMNNPYVPDEVLWGYQEYLGNERGGIVYRPVVDGAPDVAAVPVRKGESLLMVRQFAARHAPRATSISHAFVDIQYDCTTTGCSTYRLGEQSSAWTDYLSNCTGPRGFTCVAFDFPFFGRILDGGYSVTLWGHLQPGGVTDFLMSPDPLVSSRS